VRIGIVAAGIGVKSDGSAFTGPYGATLDANAFRVGPGVAPGAQLDAIRVFGCTGSSSSGGVSLNGTSMASPTVAGANGSPAVRTA